MAARVVLAITVYLWLAVCVAVQTTPAAQGEPAEARIADPAMDFIRRNGADSLHDDRILRIRRDFNNDGVPDVAVGVQQSFGNGGGPWTLYLGDSSGIYRFVPGDLGFAPRRYQLTGRDKGTGVVRGCWHMSAAECQPFEVIITSKEIRTVAVRGPFEAFLQFDDPHQCEICSVTALLADACVWSAY